jgi:hypothetical protein
MVAEVYATLGAFKAMFDMAKGLKDINDAAIRNGAVIALQEQILTAQAAQSTLIDRVNDLEKEVADSKHGIPRISAGMNLKKSAPAPLLGLLSQTLKAPNPRIAYVPPATSRARSLSSKLFRR